MLRVITSGRIAGTKIDTASDLAELNLRARLAEDRLAGLEAALDDLRAQRDDLIAQRDHWRSQAELLAACLPKPRRSWWWRPPRDQKLLPAPG
jgi:hypothetical protein